MLEALAPAPFQCIVPVHIHICMHLETEHLGLETLAEIGMALPYELILGIVHQFLCLVIERLVAELEIRCQKPQGREDGACFGKETGDSFFQEGHFQ